LTQGATLEDYLKEQLTELAGRQLESMSNKERSDNLSKLFVTVALPALGHVDVADNFDDGYTDGAGDLVIDLLIKVGHSVHIIQTKFVGWNKKLDREKLDSYQTILNRLAADSFKLHANGRLDELLQDVEWDKDTIYMWFVTNAFLDDQAKAATEIIIELPEGIKKLGLTQDRVLWDYVDRQRLYEILTESQTSDERSGIECVDIYAAKQAGKGRSDLIVLEENELKSVVMVIESGQISQYCKGSAKNKLFDFNIRNYLGEVKKNKQILITARDEPENFFLYNNGISAICEKIEINEKDGYIKAQRFSVINGAQTVRSLSKLAGGIQPKVLLRITEIPNHKERRDLLREIVRFNNTQNEIKSSDFRSNDAIQASFKDHFAKLTKDGRKCEYYAKRTDPRSKPKLTIKVEMATFAKGIFCYFHNPYELTAWGSGILFDADKDYYTAIFGPIDGSINKDDFLAKAGAYFVWEVLGEWIKNQKEEIKGVPSDESQNIRNALERKPVLMWMLHHFYKRLEQKYPGKFSEDAFLRKFANLDSLSLENKSPLMCFLIDSMVSVKDMVVYQYEQLAKTGTTQRQWVRGINNVKESLESACKSLPNLTSGVEKYIGKI